MQQNPHPTLNLIAPEARSGSASNLPDVTTVIRWRTWEQGLEEAQSRNLPILALAEPSWANSAQRIALILEQQTSLTSLLSSHVVPVLVDPDQRPDLVATWRWAAVTLTGSAGPPLLVFLTHEGQPFLSYCSMTIEGDDLYPSLASLTQVISEEYTRDPEQFLTEARNLLDSGPVTSIARTGDDAWRVLRQQLDLAHGGLNEAPKHPRPSLLWEVLEAHERGEAPDHVVAWLITSLRAMVRGGMYDQLDRGFHRGVRDDRWVLPHFEKPVPLNAQLAAVYARAADQFEDQQFRAIANHLVAFCTTALRDGVDVIGSDSDYYTWTSKEILKALEPSLVQVVSLHYDITPIPNRQALHRAIEVEDMGLYSHEDIDVLRPRLARGKIQLRLERQRRPAPPVITLEALSWRAETIRWILAASSWSRAVDVPEIVGRLEQLIDGSLDSTLGYPRKTGAAWLEDQAALLAALVAAYKVTGSALWLKRARELAEVVLSSYWRDGGWLDQPHGTVQSRAIIDDVLPSALGTLERVLLEMGELLKDAKYETRASDAATLNRRLASSSGHWSANIPR